VGLGRHEAETHHPFDDRLRREVVQRALKALERDGAIRLERARVVILDPGALKRWSESTTSPAS